MSRDSEVETEHTPGPWSVADSWATWPQKRGKLARDIFILADDVAEPCICHVATVKPDDADVQMRELANARRIVACVNACEGVPTAALEEGVIHDLLITASTVLQQIDRSNTTDILGFVIDDFRAAIAKAATP